MDIPAGLLLMGDKFRLNQIIYNLVSNAIKFSENKTVKIIIHTLKLDEKIWVNVQVKDTGIGIPEDKLEHIFEEFTQVQTERSIKQTNRMMRELVWDCLFVKC